MLQHSRGWGAAGAPLQTPKSPGAPGSPLPELLWEVKHAEPEARRAGSLQAGREAPGYDSFSFPTRPMLTSSLIRLNSQHPELHHHHSLTAKEQFSSFPPSAKTARPPTGCPGASTSLLMCCQSEVGTKGSWRALGRGRSS